MIAPDVVRRAQQGDQQALGDLLAALRPLLVRYCASKVDRNDAEDVAQVALMHVTNALKAYRPVKAIEAYATRITSNCIADYYRSQYRRGARVEPVAEVPDTCAESNAEQHVLGADLARSLALRVQTLSEQQRAVLLLRTEGFSAAEVADRLDTSPGAVRVCHLRALRRLRKAVTA